MSFKDHFSDVAAAYASQRPEYPAALADCLAARAPARRLAWEAGCGSGQLSTLLGDRFQRVVATDASVEQIGLARLHPRVEYRVAPAERSGLPDDRADLCVAAQAAHWFALEAYYAEVRRVARPGGAVALVTYGTPRVDPDVDPLLSELLAAVAPWWPPNRRSVDAGYADLAFPFDEEPFPQLDMRARWSAERMIGYTSTWSSTWALLRAGGEAALAPLHERLRAAWGSGLRTVRWPLRGRIGRVRAPAEITRS